MEANLLQEINKRIAQRRREFSKRITQAIGGRIKMDKAFGLHKTKRRRKLEIGAFAC